MNAVTDTKIFVTCVSTQFFCMSSSLFISSQDIISLVVQAMGGGMAAGSKSSQSQVNLVYIICLPFPRRIKDDKKFRVHISLWSGSYSNSVRRFTGIFSQTITYDYTVAIFVYCALAAEFISRYAQDRPKRVTAPGEATRGVIDQSLKRMLYAMSVMTTFIVIR